MSFFSYELMYWVCNHAFWVSSRPIVLHPERARSKDGFVLASNHISPLDPPIIIRHVYPRHLDFVSTVEFKRNWFVRWFLNCFDTRYLDRSSRSPTPLLQIAHCLQSGHAIAIFPEGAIRSGSSAMLNGGPVKDGFARLAQMAQVPIIPCVILGSEQYTRVSSWAPFKRTRYGIIFGEPLRIRPELEKDRAIEVLVHDFRQTMATLQIELCQAIGLPLPQPTVATSPPA